MKLGENNKFIIQMSIDRIIH